MPVAYLKVSAKRGGVIAKQTLVQVWHPNALTPSALTARSPLQHRVCRAVKKTDPYAPIVAKGGITSQDPTSTSRIPHPDRGDRLKNEQNREKLPDLTSQ